jgi:hypothetical protein
MDALLSPDFVQHGNGFDERHSSSQIRGRTRAARSIVPWDVTVELAPEAVLPTQFDDLRTTIAARPPEHRLMFAVLEDAVHLYLAGPGSGTIRVRRLFDEAERWITSDDASWPFSFVIVCQVLGLDPDCIRAGLRRSKPCREHDHVPSRLPSRIRLVSGSRHRIATNRRSHATDAGSIGVNAECAEYIVREQAGKDLPS